MLKRIEAGMLEVAYEESVAVEGTPVFLLHGFPYDVRAFDEVAPKTATFVDGTMGRKACVPPS